MAVPADTIHNWRVEAGEREQHTHVVVDTDGDLFPIDGWEVDAKIRTRPGGELLHTFPANDVAIDSDDNAVVLTIPSPTSLAWTWTGAWYRVFIRDPNTSGDDLMAYRVLSGALVVDQD